jgi:hypothetical protein
MRAVAWVGGLVVLAGLILLAVAGFPGAVPILVSAVALVAMIGLGGAMGGRHTPNVSPVSVRPEQAGPPEQPVRTEQAGPAATGEESPGGAPGVS